MKRWNLLWVGVLAAFVWGCENQNAKPKSDTATAEPNAPATLQPLPPENPYTAEPGTPPPGGGAGGSDVLVPPAATGRTHVVARGDSFYSLARKYYGDQRQWKKIWEANKARVPDPKKLPVGTKLVIP